MKFLFVIDAVKGFVNEGVFRNDRAEAKIPNIVKLCEEFKNDNLIFIKDAHSAGSKEFETYSKHCIKGTSEAELVEELKPYEELDNAISLEKNCTNGMVCKNVRIAVEDLVKMASSKDKVELHFCGFITEVCVMQLVLSLKAYVDDIDLKSKMKFVVHSDCVDTYDTLVHNADQINKFVFENFIQNGIEVV